MVKEQLQLLNKAGAQRMLTQELVKLLMMKKFGIGDDEDNEEEINRAVSDFKETLEELKKYNLNDEIIESQLRKVEGAWERFLSSITRDEFDKTIEINGEVLIEMEKAVSAYERLFSKLRSENA